MKVSRRSLFSAAPAMAAASVTKAEGAKPKEVILAGWYDREFGDDTAIWPDIATMLAKAPQINKYFGAAGESKEKDDLAEFEHTTKVFKDFLTEHVTMDKLREEGYLCFDVDYADVDPDGTITSPATVTEVEYDDRPEMQFRVELKAMG